MFRIFLCFWICFGLTEIYAQSRCGFDQHYANTSQLESEANFETWLQEKIADKKAKKIFRLAEESIYNIPVVVHVIHDGSSLGNGSNLSDEKILEQIAILNKDYSRTNEDAIETLEEFKGVATDTGIRFQLAKQDPEGMPTTGIVRIKGNKPAYGTSTAELIELATHSYWPHTDYFNIYIADLVGDFLGFAQFPFSNLEGVSSDLKNYILTDAVFIDYNWVGINPHPKPFESYGRTATHEIGHFLGLKHIWGGSSCFIDDYCGDTPPADKATTGCPLDKTSCDTLNMIQNYMDYTDDVCMNVFTKCQKDRMRIILEESPRRASLLSSHGLDEPVVANTDIGIRSVISPKQSTCKDQVSPGIQVRNYGSTTISKVDISLYLNNVLKEEKTFLTNIISGGTSEITFLPISMDAFITNELRFEIVTANDTFDENDQNDIKTITLAPFQSHLPPYQVLFNDGDLLHSRTENNQQSQWKLAQAIDTSASNQAACLPFFNSKINFGYEDILMTQTIDLSALTSAQLNFKYAYAARTTSEYDGLKVIISTDCGQTFPYSNQVFERYAKSLTTTTYQNTEFVPDRASDWNEININITRFAGEESVQVGFIGFNGSGNNLYIDNITVSSANLPALDMGIKEVKNIPVVVCENTSIYPKVMLKNYGYLAIDSLKLSVFNNSKTFNLSLDDLDMQSGETKEITLREDFELIEGENTFKIQIDKINNVNDTIESNNVYATITVVNSETEPIPVLENLDRTNWTLAHPDGSEFLSIMRLANNYLLKSKSFQNPKSGSSYFVSPDLDVRGYNEAALRFDYSYAQKPGFTDNLKVLLSTNCGKTFDIELLSLDAEQMAVSTINDEWQPQGENDWKQVFIDISDYLIWRDLRLAFVFTNGNGNSLYIDNINVLTTNDPALPGFDTQMEIYPNPATSKFHVAFNLPDKQTVHTQLLDMSGRIVIDQTFDNIINQTLTFFAPTQAGFYILSVNSKDLNTSKRLFIKQ